MTINKAKKVLEEFIGQRGEHHAMCSSHEWPHEKPCDCYAKGRTEAYEALDFILAAMPIKTK